MGNRLIRLAIALSALVMVDPKQELVDFWLAVRTKVPATAGGVGF